MQSWCGNGPMAGRCSRWRMGWAVTRLARLRRTARSRSWWPRWIPGSACGRRSARRTRRCSRKAGAGRTSRAWALRSSRCCSRTASTTWRTWGTVGPTGSRVRRSSRSRGTTRSSRRPYAAVSCPRKRRVARRGGTRSRGRSGRSPMSTSTCSAPSRLTSRTWWRCARMDSTACCRTRGSVMSWPARRTSTPRFARSGGSPWSTAVTTT